MNSFVLSVTMQATKRQQPLVRWCEPPKDVVSGAGVVVPLTGMKHFLTIDTGNLIHFHSWQKHFIITPQFVKHKSWMVNMVNMFQEIWCPEEEGEYTFRHCQFLSTIIEVLGVSEKKCTV